MFILRYEICLIDKILNIFKMIIMTFQGLKEYPTETEQDFYHNMGNMNFGGQFYEMALEYYEKMIKNDSDDYLGYQRKADVFKETGHPKEAREQYALALEKARHFKNYKNQNNGKLIDCTKGKIKDFKLYRNMDVNQSISEIKKELSKLKE